MYEYGVLLWCNKYRILQIRGVSGGRDLEVKVQGLGSTLLVRLPINLRMFDFIIVKSA